MAAVAALVDEVDKKQTTGTTQIDQAEPVKAGATVLEVAASAARRHITRLHLSRIPRSFQHHWQTFSSCIWYWVEELFEEFQPWLKWIIFDAALSLLVNWLVSKVEAVRPVFEAIGWA